MPSPLKKITTLLIGLLLVVYWVGGAGFVTSAQEDNPPLPGFDLTGSDANAMRVADRVMASMGGRSAWDSVRFVTWNFFGRRAHVWDKHTGSLRFVNEDLVVLMNITTRAGKAWKAGVLLQGAELDEALNRTHGAWINDSYWVFMPYKLKDTGVTLKHLGEGKTAAGASAEILQLTFSEVGRTPQNKYHVYVDKDSDLVVQWDYYPDAADAEPRFQIPWNEWREHGPILLSADRGERKHENVAVLENVPMSVFTSPESVDVMQYKIQ